MQESSHQMSILLPPSSTTFIFCQTDVSGGLQRRAFHPTHRTLGQWSQCLRNLSVVKFIVFPNLLSYVVNCYPFAHSPVDKGNRWLLSSIWRRIQKPTSLSAKLVRYFLPFISASPNNRPITIL